MNATPMLDAALRYADLGYKVFPCLPGRKTPATEHGFLDAATDAERIEAWWKERPNANVGVATEGLLVIDVDHADNPWLNDEPEKWGDLEGATQARTPRGGRHFFFRQPANTQLICTQGELAPKVDTRADGGYVLVAPSKVGGKPYIWVPGLELDQPPGRLAEPPAWLVEVLAIPAPKTRSFAKSRPKTPTLAHASAGGTPGNPIPEGQRNATLARLGGAMRRVGMGQPEIAAALRQANADRCKPPLADGEVERIAASVSRYEPDQISVAMAEDHWSQLWRPTTEVDVPDPGPLPDELLRIPGFVGEVMDYCLETAPYPNLVMAFCGAVAMQAFLAGRKVRDPGDNRTNVYLLGLAHSAAGKDWPRKINSKIAFEIGLANSLGERFASGEGIQDALFVTPSMLFQTDEIDGLLQSINRAVDARHESIMSTLLTLYTSAATNYPMRRKAGREHPGVIHQPSLTIFGTAIPNHYYAALSERMLTNGLFARMMILEGVRRGCGQEPRIVDLPPRIIDIARWWADFHPGTGNLDKLIPLPRVVEYASDARQLIVEARVESEREYALAEERSDPVGTTVWGRISEHIRKFALIYAASANHQSPAIDADAVRWATRLVMHQTRRMLFMARSHVAENPFHADCLRLLQRLREAPDHAISHSVLLKRMKLDTQSFQKLIQTLVQQGDVVVEPVKSAGRTGNVYRLAGGE